MRIKVGKLYKVVPCYYPNGGVYTIAPEGGFIPTNAIVIVIKMEDPDYNWWLVVHDEKIHTIDSMFLKELSK